MTSDFKLAFTCLFATYVVKNHEGSEILLYLQAAGFLVSFLDGERRQIPEMEAKDFIVHKD